MKIALKELVRLLNAMKPGKSMIKSADGSQSRLYALSWQKWLALLMQQMMESATGRAAHDVRELRRLQQLVVQAKACVGYEAYETTCPGEAAKLDGYARITESFLQGRSGPQRLESSVAWARHAQQVCQRIIRDVERRYRKGKRAS